MSQIVLAVNLPLLAVPGDKINVSTPDGRVVEIIVPEGCRGRFF